MIITVFPTCQHCNWFFTQASRMLAAKASLAARVDALGENVTSELGIEHRAALTIRLKELEEGVQRRVSSGMSKAKPKNEKYSAKR